VKCLKPKSIQEHSGYTHTSAGADEVLDTTITMTAIPGSVFEIMSRLRTAFKSDDANQTYSKDEPLQSELFTLEQLNRHGAAIALKHKLHERSAGDQLLARLSDNEDTLLQVRNLLVETIRDGKNIAPGAEWLIDNFYLIEEQVVLARRHLPKGYSKALPSLANCNPVVMPRAYAIVLEIISHSDGRVDAKSLSSFVAAYQTNALLTLGELWAIPIMLRLAVIENLRRVCSKIALDLVDHNLADYWADRMIKTVKDQSADLILTIAEMAGTKPALTSPFVAGFIRKLQGKGPVLALSLTWMEQKLSILGFTGAELVQQENQNQASDQVSVRNSIETLRGIGATDWREFVETLSSVEQVFRQDSTGTYPLMDFATRDRYRHAVEHIAKGSAMSEAEVAHKVMQLSADSKNVTPRSGRQHDIGYHLIDKGLRKTELAIGMRYTFRQRVDRVIDKMPVALYLLSIATLTALIAIGMSHVALIGGHYSDLTFVFICLAIVVCGAHLAVSIVNWLGTVWIKPKLLPRMDYSEGIPAECRTLVAIPTMLSSGDYIGELVEALEIRFLANKEAMCTMGC
jgi:cyclic beta-1,2-glucan synthetase